MDKKLLDALSNLSVALEEIAKALNDKSNNVKSDTGNALKTTDIGNTLMSINEGIKDIKKDTSDIKKDQSTILNILRSKKLGTSTMEEAGDGVNKAKLKDGVKMVLLIAAGVLAVGLAMKLIGPVEILSVIAISTAILLIANAFAKMAEIKNLTVRSVFISSLALIAMSMSIAVSSWLLSAVVPLGLGQLFTILMIGATFAVLSFSLGTLMNNLGKIKNPLMSLALLPLVMVAVSLAMALSSEFFAMIRPLSFNQIISAIGVSLLFYAISMALPKISKAMADLDVTKIALLPIVMVAVAFAISESSRYLANVTPLTMAAFLTSIGVAIVMVVISYALPMLSSAMENVDIGKIALFPVVMVAMSYAIMYSSGILAQTTVIPLGKLFNIVLYSVGLAIIGIAMGFTMNYLGKMGIENIVKGALSILIIAGTIALASQLLTLGDYSNPIDINWTIGTGAALLVFGLAAVGLGLLSMSGVGALAIPIGAAMTLVVAGAIVATSHILKLGNYSGGPSVEWAKGVGLSLLAFGTSAVALGMLVVGTFGVGALAIESGINSVKMIAQAIVDTSYILKKGTYTGGPSETWAKGVSIALSAFSPIYKMLVADKIMDALFDGGVSVEDFKSAIISICEGIIQASNTLRGGVFTGGPGETWSKGVSLAISAFSPIYKMLVAEKIMDALFGGGGVSVEKFKSAIVTICEGIIQASNTLRGGDFTGGPDETWSKGVSGAINAFSPVFKFINDNNGWFSDDATETMTKGINAITMSLYRTSIILSRGKFDKIIPKDYIVNLARNIGGYLGIVKAINNDDNVNGLFGLYKVNRVSDSMVRMANGINKLSQSINNLNQSIDVEKLNSLKNFNGSVVLLSLMDSEGFGDMMDKLEEKSNILKDTINSVVDSDDTKTSAVSVKPVSKSTTKPGRSNDDLYNILSSMDQKLANISENSNAVSNYINSLSNDIKIKRK